MQERDKLRSQIDNLRTTIVESKIPLPEGVEDIGPPCAPPPPPLFDLDMPATVSYSNDGLDHPRLHVNFPQHQEPSSQGLDFSTQTYPLATPYQGHQQYTNVPQSAPDLPNDFSLNTINLSSSSSRYGIPAEARATALVDTIEIAIDFVLALEHPCMPHIPYQDPPSTEPANHMMLVSTPLMARSPDPPQFNSTWTASGAIIKELLNLSSSINLEGEITPVEAWHRLHNHPDFWKLGRDQIEKLKLELSTAVRCYGFGAVMEENVFSDALNRALASSAIAS
ncbi:MAG: hypothetical protein ALECFALPRED_005638 [Alectoria fallacina]|uniref:Uncharacterized protein n=1 Tax=Alectoria fallacina TaxID=1903189 RepID=A0A8H3IMM7_9LECA|nr:MAG: hypothetical protein ALECFALPRED_005638 [Alectoria fallacina]